MSDLSGSRASLALVAAHDHAAGAAGGASAVAGRAAGAVFSAAARARNAARAK